MPTYIILGRFTDQGIRNIKNGPQRLDQVRGALEAVGGTMPGFYLTMGQYDFVAVSEAPDDESFTRVLLSIVSNGNVTTQTLKAFPEDDYRRIIASLP
jgi:uncharacterized protein with GYD domain